MSAPPVSLAPFEAGRHSAYARAYEAHALEAKLTPYEVVGYARNAERHRVCCLIGFLRWLNADRT